MIQRKYWLTLILLCVLGAAATTGATQDSGASAAVAPKAHAPSRGRAYPALPDWFGQWEIVGMTPGATGGFVQPTQEVMQEIAKWGPPPYNPRMGAVFQATASRGPPTSFTHPLCTFGFPMVMLSSPLMFEILPTPKETNMVFSGREIRHIYTDGRPHPAKDDLWPTYWGDSIGHWEGQTLVIDTIEVSSPFAPGMTLIIAFGGADNHGALVAILSPEAHFIERIRMTDKDHLEDRMTIMDPLNFVAPWHVIRQYQRVAQIHRMVHEDCEGEERNPIVNGQYTLAPPPPNPQQPPMAPPPQGSAPH
jgi:hypothetical protein